MSNGDGWYYVKNGETVGPVSREVLDTELAGAGGPSALVWGPGVSEWTEARHVAALGVGTARRNQPPRVPRARRADVIDYELFGDDMQFVEITLDPELHADKTVFHHINTPDTVGAGHAVE